MNDNSKKTKEALAIASFVVAALIVAFCLCVPPYGEIDSSALWAMAQFLIMCCTLLEVSAAFDKFFQHYKREDKGR